MKTAHFERIFKDRLFSDEGVEIWQMGRDYAVIAKDDVRYGKFYPISKYDWKSLFDIDPLLKQRFHGVYVKRDSNPVEI